MREGAGPGKGPAPPWMRAVLLAAAAYNALWGAFVVFFPLALFRAFGMEPPNYPELWQCIGMIVGVYGLAYAAASLDPLRHWPVVAAGLLGKVLGPIGFAGAVLEGVFPVPFALVIVFNDLIWWVPFSLILLHSYRSYRSPKGAPV